MSELLHTFRRKPLREKAATLVVTLLVMVLLSTIVVAFTQAVSRERAAARSVANRYQAELAAEAGLAYATSLLARLTSNDHYIVYANTNGQLFIGNGANQTAANFSYTPLFSTTTNITATISNTITNGVPIIQVASGNLFTNTLAGNLSTTSPPVTWINLPLQSGPYASRFAFWIEDLGGRVDLSIAGTNHANPQARRPTGTNASELGVWSFFDNTATSAVSTPAETLYQNRPLLLTPATIRLAETSVTTNQLAEFAVRLRHDTNEPEVIPYGFGYTNAGQPKADINSFVATGNVMGLAEVINTNLPLFGTSRRGGMAETVGNYTATIAASAIDYADLNSTPTVQTNAPRYRGVDSTPFTTILYNKYDWYATGNSSISMRLSTFIQLWNVSNQNITGDFSITQINKDVLGGIGWSRGTNTLSTNNLSMQPNEIRVIGFTEDLTIPTGAFPVASDTISVPQNFDYYFTTQWNGGLLDELKTGAEREARNIRRQPAGASRPPSWAGFLPGLRYADSTTTNTQPTGDPRSTFYITSSFVTQDYDTRTAWGGMAVMRPMPGRFLTQPMLWSDPITNTSKSVPLPESSVKLDEFATNVSQLTNGSTPSSVNHSPQIISNTGSFSRITELGNIYDPAQWFYSTYPSNSIPTNATANSRYGGGFTLRIGRPEHPLFTNDGRRATQLLDILAAGPTVGNGTVINPVAGRININTASTNALRALAAGIFHTNDPILAPSGTNFVPPAGAVTAFVDSVFTNRIYRRPFFSTADLATLATNTNASSWPTNSVFGNPLLLGARLWNDASAEEWFAKILPLTTVRSRNFLVHLVAQTITTNTTPTVLAEQRRIYQIYLQPLRSSSGITTNSAPVTINAWGL